MPQAQDLSPEAMARETEKIIELGNDSARQANYIKSVLDQHVAVFLDAKESDGKSFPDFVGPSFWMRSRPALR